MTRISEDLKSCPHNPAPATNERARTMQRLGRAKLPNIAIVGAGVSGLRCADVLTRAGAKVTIFEARDRIGGRVHQVKNGGYLVDTGSNWIHGTEGNPIMKLAERTNTDVMDPERSEAIFNDHGKRLPKDEAEFLMQEFWNQVLHAFKYSDENSANIDSKTSLLDRLKKKWSKEPLQHDLIETSRVWGQFVGSPIERQSLRFFFLEDGLDGENVFVASTYKKILDEIAKPALARADIRTNTEVKSIRYRATDHGEDSVSVSFGQGPGLEYDEVVVTCPLGWLKQYAADVFEPALPERLLQAIENIGYGALEKLYVTFPNAFWLIDNDKDSYTCFTNFHNPTGYHPILAAENIETVSWHQSVVSLAHLPGKSAQPTLLFYMTGDSGTYVNAKLKDLPTHSNEYNEILRTVAEPFYSRLPNYDSLRPECTPTSFYQTLWQTDQYAGNGSYSTFRTGLEHGDTDIEIMRAAGGLAEAGRGLWLAGEHTAPFVALGTTTGAFWSGEGVARRIAKQYDLDVPSDELHEASADVSIEAGGVKEDVQDLAGTKTINPGKNQNGPVMQKDFTQNLHKI